MFLLTKMDRTFNFYVDVEMSKLFLKLSISKKEWKMIGYPLVFP